MNRSLSSATKWLSTKAYNLFSSSNESTTSSDDGDSIYSAPSKPNKGRATSTKKSIGQKRQLHRELLPQVTHSRTRFSSKTLEKEEVRFMLTLKALPPALRVIGQLLHPVPRSAQEEHLLACKLMAGEEELQAKPNEIAIPTFKRLPSLRTVKEVEKNIKEKEIITDDACLHRHRPLELAERRERRREDELIRYEQYIRKLGREYPELLNRKYSSSSSSIGK